MPKTVVKKDADEAKAAKTEKVEKAPRESKDLSPNMIRVLECLVSEGIAKTSSELAEATGISKGKRLPQLVEKGYIVEIPPKEGERGKKFKYTAAGRKALDKALKEQAKG